MKTESICLQMSGNPVEGHMPLVPLADDTANLLGDKFHLGP